VATFIVFSKPKEDWVAMKLRFSPTIEELGEEFNRTLESVWTFLKALISRKLEPTLINNDEPPRQPELSPITFGNNIVWGHVATL
jgi:hypothetical protein